MIKRALTLIAYALLYLLIRFAISGVSEDEVYNE